MRQQGQRLRAFMLCTTPLLQDMRWAVFFLGKERGIGLVHFVQFILGEFIEHRSLSSTSLAHQMSKSESFHATAC